jgi:hypothetical protein
MSVVSTTVYDTIAAAFPETVAAFTVRVSDQETWSTSGVLTSRSMFRQLFTGGPGSRTNRNLVAKVTGWPSAGDIEATLPGLSVVFSDDTELRIVAAAKTLDGGLVRMTLDSIDAVTQ